MKIYKVVSEGSWCAYDTLESALEHIMSYIETDIEFLEVGEETLSFYIEIDEMTKEEYDNLPEFNGY